MQSNMEFYSPLRYPGGKVRLAPYVKKVIEGNKLLDGTYIEPYVGGGGVALSLLFDEYVSKIIINDKDRSIYAFWHSVIYENNRLCEMINDANIDLENWNRQKEIQKYKADASLLELGFSTFFLNRTNRSGIINAGVIGGHDQQGKYKIDARFQKNDLIRKIKKIAFYATRIELHNDDALTLLENTPTDEKTLFYFDPPYYVKGRGLYMNYYNDSDHEQIANAIFKIKDAKWILSYDNVPFIENLYKGFRNQAFELNYSANNSGKGKEIMFYSDNLKYIPKIEEQ